MTPVAKKATAAERAMVITTSTKHPTAVDCQRDEFLAMWSDPRPDQPADEADDATLAFHSDLDRLLAAARAEAVAPVLDVMRAVLAVAPRCDSKRQANTGRCGEVAVHSSMGVHRCDAHGEGWKDGPRSRAMRAALALLAADQAGEKAGKP